jgi:OmpA family protein
MRSALPPAILMLAAVSLAACAASPPAGPTVMATPSNGTSFEQFRAYDFRCRQYATGANNGETPQQGAVSSGVGSAAAGTVLGAAAGALLGAATGAPGVGAAFGAGSGLLIGSAVGGGNAEASASALQANYDRVYTQCMIGSGQNVSVAPVVAAYPQPVVAVPPPVVVVAPSYGYGHYYGYHAGW